MNEWINENEAKREKISRLERPENVWRIISGCKQQLQNYVRLWVWTKKANGSSGCYQPWMGNAHRTMLTHLITRSKRTKCVSINIDSCVDNEFSLSNAHLYIFGADFRSNWSRWEVLSSTNKQWIIDWENSVDCRLIDISEPLTIANGLNYSTLVSEAQLLWNHVQFEHKDQRTVIALFSRVTWTGTVDAYDAYT